MTPPDTIRSLREVSLADIQQVGGKAAGLGEISKAGCEVPPGFVVPRQYYERWLDRDLGQSFENEIREQCERLGAKYYAVRSSGIVEDGTSASWAGQFDTYLGIEQETVLARIYDCWKSPGSVHATAYAKQNDALSKRWDMAVVVQAMIASEVSGVLFTVDPVARDYNVCSLEAVAGLGEFLVQGRVTPQSYVINRDTGKIVEERLHRQHKALKLTDTGIEEIELPPEYVLPLTVATIADLVSIGLRLELHFGRPQDIEWTYAKGILSVVQSRPITTL